MKLMQNVSVAVARKSARTVALRHTTRMPVRTSSANDVLAGGGAIVSRFPILPSSSADTTNVTASTAIAIGAVSHGPARRPAPGPNFGDGVDGLALAVGVEQALRGTEPGDVHVVGEVVEHRGHAGDDGDREEQRQRDVTEKCGERNGEQRDRAHEIGADHERPPAAAVDDAAADPREDGSGKCQRDGEVAELDGAGARGDDRGDGQRRPRDARADGRMPCALQSSKKSRCRHNPPRGSGNAAPRRAATANRSP